MRHVITMDDEFKVGERVQVVEPVVWLETDGDNHIAKVFVPGEDLYVARAPQASGTDRYLVRCPATGDQSDVSGSMLVAMPPYGETIQRALQAARLSCRTLAATAMALQQSAERQAAVEGGPAFANVVFSGPPGPDSACVFVEVEDDEGNGFSAGEWRDRGDGTWALRMPYGAPRPDSRIESIAHLVEKAATEEGTDALLTLAKIRLVLNR